MNYLKVIGFGLLNYLIRFGIAGALYMGIGMNPTGFWYGLIVTLVSFVVALLLLRYAVKPKTTGEAVTAAVIWIIIALILDVVTAEPIVKVSVSFLFSEIQTWTRLAAILVASFFAVKK